MFYNIMTRYLNIKYLIRTINIKHNKNLILYHTFENIGKLLNQGFISKQVRHVTIIPN